MTMNEIRQLVMKLSPEEREMLGVELLSSLDDPQAQIDHEAAWAEVILARSKAYRDGSVIAFDARSTLARLRQRLTTEERS